jgi:predicted nucleic acid-binding protein
MQKIVLDCSITMSWCFQDETTDSSMTLLGSLDTVSLHVPALWTLETANALATAHRRGRINDDDLTASLLFLEMLPLEIDDRGASASLTDVLPLALAFELTAYDATYLELAMRIEAPLCTLDSRLQSAAKRAGIDTHEIAHED